jgi:hypothetical protein
VTIEQRKEINHRLVTHPRLATLRKQLAAVKFSPLPDSFKEKCETLTRRFKGLKMPKGVARLTFGYTVRPCIAGLPFNFCIFQHISRPSAEFLSRLADVITFHFRNSRVRGEASYNFNAQQAATDSIECLGVLEQFSELLKACGLPIKADTTNSSERSLHDRIDALEKRIAELENEAVCRQPGHIKAPETEKEFPPALSPGWCNTTL